MGSGKTTVARELAHLLKCEWADLDQLIKQHEGREPAEIIELEGETVFRDIETRMLRKVLDLKSREIVAAGGGAWTIPRNREQIREYQALTIWLDAPFELCWKRIEKMDEVRPLARSRQMAQDLFEERRPIYELAELRILVNEGQTGVEIANNIVAALSRS